MADRPIITPRTLKGFRDFLPEAAIPREWLIDTAKQVLRSFGFSPIDTPALEYSEVILGKGSEETDRQSYRFEDHGGRDVALRFDLTVPLARFAAMYTGVLGTPFRRYHVGPVWRGENPQRGRYREFLQCDFDTIGVEGMVADVETGLVIHDLFVAFGFERFTIRANNRKVLNGILERLDLADRSVGVLRAIDKLPKIGRESVEEELRGFVGVGATQAEEILRLASIEGSNHEMVDRLAPLVAGSTTGGAGVAELADLVAGIEAAGAGDRLRLDITIARGLDYYTGTVFETFLDDLPAIGSCCSGGRYDDLASTFTKQRLPGIGASVGVDRLLTAMEELGLIEATSTPSPVLVVLFDEARWADYVALAAHLRRAGISVELYPQAKKLGAQLRYADRRGHRYAVIVGSEEWDAGTAQVKDLRSGESRTVGRSVLAAELTAAGAGKTQPLSVEAP